jgi:hypothetical protein
VCCSQVCYCNEWTCLLVFNQSGGKDEKDLEFDFV